MSASFRTIILAIVFFVIFTISSGLANALVSASFQQTLCGCSDLQNTYPLGTEIDCLCYYSFGKIVTGKYVGIIRIVVILTRFLLPLIISVLAVIILNKKLRK